MNSQIRYKICIFQHILTIFSIKFFIALKLENCLFYNNGEFQFSSFLKDRFWLVSRSGVHDVFFEARFLFEYLRTKTHMFVFFLERHRIDPETPVFGLQCDQYSLNDIADVICKHYFWFDMFPDEMITQDVKCSAWLWVWFKFKVKS